MEGTNNGGSVVSNSLIASVLNPFSDSKKRKRGEKNPFSLSDIYIRSICITVYIGNNNFENAFLP